MTPKVTLRKAVEDPELLGSALAGPTWHAWRSLLIAAMGEPLTKDELKTFTKFTGWKTPPSQRVDELWCCVGRRGGKSGAMAVLATYLAGLCDHSDKLARGEKGVGGLADRARYETGEGSTRLRRRHVAIDTNAAAADRATHQRHAGLNDRHHLRSSQRIVPAQ